MIAACDLGGRHVLIANGAHVVELTQLGDGCLWQGRNFVHRRTPLHEHTPAGTRLAPDVEVRMDAHHQCTDGAAGFER